MTLKNYEELKEITEELKLTQDEYWEEIPQRHYFRSGYNEALKNVLDKTEESLNSSVTIKLADGIDIVVNDKKLMWSQVSVDETIVALKMNEEGHVVNYEINLKDKTVQRVKYGSHIL